MTQLEYRNIDNRYGGNELVTADDYRELAEETVWVQRVFDTYDDGIYERVLLPLYKFDDVIWSESYLDEAMEEWDQIVQNADFIAIQDTDDMMEYEIKVAEVCEE